MTDAARAASKTLGVLDANLTSSSITRIYANPDDINRRRPLIRDALTQYIKEFGDGPVHVVRCPARVNLRGMHVDTHGGYLNLMAIPRETIVVTGPSPDDSSRAVSSAAPGSDWVHGPPAHSWHGYIEGALAEVHDRYYGSIPAFNMSIASDIPIGSGLSSSSALCTAAHIAVSTFAGVESSPEETALAVQRAEWRAGARVGLSDQSAMLLARAGHVANIAIHPREPDFKSVRHVVWPGDWTIVVADSATARSLSGAQRVAYARNRFAYSAAMEIFRQALRDKRYDEAFVAETQLLRDISTGRFEAHGGGEALAKILNGIDESIEIEQLKDIVGDQAMQDYASYFGDLPEDDKPKTFALRGSMIYGIAESERARLIADAIDAGDITRTGMLMSRGHDGDRVMRSNGSPYHTDSYATLPIERSTGSYGASTPALDYLVDMALASGAHGASLTGAGLGGAIIALYERDDVVAGIEALQAALASDEMARRYELVGATTDELARASVFPAYPIAAAGVLSL